MIGLMAIVEILFVIVIMKCIAYLGIANCCIIYAIFSAGGALISGAGFGAICMAFLSGIVSGAIAYLAARFFLFLIDVMGAFAYFLIVLVMILLIVAIIL